MQTEKVGFDAKNEMRQISLEKQLFGDSSLYYFFSMILYFSKLNLDLFIRIEESHFHIQIQHEHCAIYFIMHVVLFIPV